MSEMVLFDPQGTYWEGALVSGDVARVIRSNRGATIPIDTDLLNLNAVAGYYSRSFGGGIKPSTAVPARICPMLLYTVPPGTVLNWRLRLQAVEGEQPTGSLRIVTDSSQRNAYAGGLNAGEGSGVAFGQLGDPDQFGGWEVGNQMRISPVEGYLSLMVYGAGTGVRISRATVSQTAV